LVYLSPFDFEGMTPVINPLQLPPHDPKDYETLVRLTTLELERTLDNIFSEMFSGFTGQMKSVLGPCIETLIRKGNCDLWDLMRFMDDNQNHDLVEAGRESPNHAVSLFFTHNFSDIVSETRKGIEWRCRTLLKSQVFAGLTSGNTTAPLRQLINQRKIIIFNLDKGKMGTDVSSHFGKLIVSLIQVIAMQRGGLPEERKVPISLYIDEYHNYVTQAIKEVLSEARSNKLFLTLAQQNVGQGILQRDFKSVLMGNTNIKILGQSSLENYSELSKEFDIDVKQLLRLPQYYYYVKIGNGKTFRIKGRDGLINDKNAMLPEQWKAIVSDQLLRYYVPVDKAIEERRSQETIRIQNNPIPQTKSSKKNLPVAKKKEKDDTDKPDNNTLYPF
jgi:hypothetical protein